MSRHSDITSQRGVLLALLILITSSTPSIARIRNVPRDYNTIQAGIDAAQANDTVLVQPGNYRENLELGGRTITLASLILTTGDSRYIAETVINGGWNGRSAIRMASAESGVVSGFTIQNDSSDFGGGIYMRGGTPTIANLVIENCKASRNGAALYATGAARPFITNVVLHHNNAFSIGGAMSVFGGAVATIENSVIYDNYAGHVGGALHVNGASAVLRGCTIVRNAALHSGGGIYLTQGATVVATDCIFFEDEPDEIWILAGFVGTTFTAGFCNIDGLLNRIYAPVGADLYMLPGNIGDDPSFTNLENWDLTLSAESPCIDAGHFESTPDADGTRRDIGRYSRNQQQAGQRVRIVPAGYQTIQRAVDAANEGDVVFVRPGTYRENVLVNGKNLLIGSRLLTTGDSSYIDSTVIDAQARSFGVAFSGNISNETMLRGLTIKNGRQNFGGGIDCRQGTAPVLEDLVVRENTALQWGGGVYCTGGSAPVLRRVVLKNNQAARGGGMAAANSSPVIEWSRISENQASDRGGGFCGVQSTLQMSHTLVNDNRAGAEGGGGIYVWDCPENGEVELDHLTVANNSVEGDFALAFGGVSVQVEEDPFEVVISNSIIYGNGPRESGFFTNHEEIHDNLNVAISYTDLRNGEEDVVVNQGAILHWGEGNFDADPGFINADGGDFHLGEGSPCIDGGDPTFDRDPDLTISDIGSFYYHQFIQRDPATLHVPEDYYTIQEAINASMNLDTIIVAPGRYGENLDYHGKNIVVASRFLHTSSPRFIRETIIDGGGVGSCALFNRNEVFNTRLIGFTLTNGLAREGGGVFCFRAHPTIQNCVITGNTARDGGGGIYCYGAQPTLDNLTIIGNDGGDGGGGLHLRNLGMPTVKNSIIRENVGAEIEYSADRDNNTVTVRYSDVEGGQGGIRTNNNGVVEWEAGNFNADPQFVAQEQGDYTLGEGSPCIDTGDPGGRVDPDGSRADVGALAFDSRPPGEEFTIPMLQGWNLIGSPVTPPEPSMTTVWTELVGAGRLLMVKDQNGRFYQPAREFSNMQDWDVKQGYMVKVATDANLTIEGETLPADAPISLRQGWSFISYQPTDAVSVVDGFAGVTDELILVKDGLGRFYSPIHHFNSIPELHRGAGYKVQSVVSTELVWQGGARQIRREGDKFIDAVERIPEHFTAVTPTGEDMSLLFEVSGTGMNDWEVGVFTEAGLCVGAGVIAIQQVGVEPPKRAVEGTYDVDGEALEGRVLVGIPIRGDDPTTPAIDGARAGQILNFMVWNGEAERSISPRFMEGEGIYAADGFALASLSLSNDKSITPYTLSLSSYPNPFNGTVQIRYTLPEAGVVRLAIFDIGGRETARLVDADLKAGEYRASWESAAVASGVYFLRLQTGGEVKMQKMMMVK